MKQTAVEWLAQKFEELLVKLDFNEISEEDYLEEWKNIIIISKEMEKEQGYSEEDMIRFANLYSDININESHLQYFNNLPKFKNK